MKNLTIKKVALGLFLAGYAASSAFALDATTAAINGNAPVLKSAAGAADHTVAVRVATDAEGNNLIGNRAAKVNDYVVIKFNVDDKDGDLDTGKIKDTLKVYIKRDVNDPWTEIANLSDLVATNNDENGQISFKLDNQFRGAQKIGFKLLERTDFGLPYAGKWLQVNDIWAQNSSPMVEEPADPNAPESTGPADPGSTTELHGPGDTTVDNGYGPVASGVETVGIFKVVNGVPDKSVNYANAGAPAPVYGETFAAIAWDDADQNNALDSGETEITTNYTFAWHLAGSYEGVDADVEEITQGVTNGEATNSVITLGSADGAAKHNALYSSAYKAGAQGYKLKVITN
ncbi:hypothetical protein [Gilliamella sp. App4-10]|uniref:hypothetical protein n=1 Tax=Gilliamella sp. App4-10 TaxID=3120231 RepID=UPI00080E6A38|nr:hypothetical protein [Gilliamella apicola]OCG23106.1 hypothetical protein A9G23_00345 [Gilliamella apicola]